MRIHTSFVRILYPIYDGASSISTNYRDNVGAKNLLVSGFGLEFLPNLQIVGQIVFRSNRDGNDEIYTMDSDGNNIDRLTTNSAVDLIPRWSPDGKQIAFSSNRDGNPGGVHEVYVMDSNGSGRDNRWT